MTGEEYLGTQSRDNALIKIINACINKTELPKVQDYAAVFNLAKRHSLGGMFFLAIKDCSEISDEIKTTAQQHFSANTAQQISQEYYAEKIFEKFKEKGIKFMPLKGYYMRRLYPIPEMRVSCDLDIFYDKVRKDEVSEILKELGFTFVVEVEHAGQWKKGSITIETHHELATNRESYFDYYRDVWTRLKTIDGIEYNFTDEDFYIYSIIHAAKHFSHGGFGIRTVLDIYIYNLKKQLNQEYLDKEFDKLKLSKFRKCFEKLARVWFGEEETDEQTEILANYILSSATYGTMTDSLASKNEMISSSSAKSARFKYVFGNVFLKYSCI